MEGQVCPYNAGYSCVLHSSPFCNHLTIFAGFPLLTYIYKQSRKNSGSLSASHWKILVFDNDIDGFLKNLYIIYDADCLVSEVSC